MREERAHLDVLFRRCVEPAQLAVLAKPAGCMIDRANDLIDGGLGGTKVIRVRHHEAQRAAQRKVIGDTEHHCAHPERRCSASASTGHPPTARWANGTRRSGTSA